MSNYAPSTHGGWGSDDKASYHAPSLAPSFSSWGTVYTSASQYPIPQQSPYLPHPATPSVHSPSQTGSPYHPSPALSYQTGSSSHYTAPSAASYRPPTEVHPALRPGAGHTLLLDVANAQLPSTLRALDPSMSAFNPPLERVSLEFQGLHPQWKARIDASSIAPYPSSASTGAFVTLHALLSTIHTFCRSEIRRDQQASIPPAKRQAANANHQLRLRRPREGSPTAGGLVMLDVMGTETMFIGMAPRVDRDGVKEPEGKGETWVVYFSMGGGAPVN